MSTLHPKKIEIGRSWCTTTSAVLTVDDHPFSRGLCASDLPYSAQGSGRFQVRRDSTVVAAFSGAAGPNSYKRLNSRARNPLRCNRACPKARFFSHSCSRCRQSLSGVLFPPPGHSSFCLPLPSQFSLLCFRWSAFHCSLQLHDFSRTSRGRCKLVTESRQL